MAQTYSESDVRRLLDARERELDAEIAASQQREEPAPREVGDMKDGAELNALAEVATAEMERDLAELRGLRAARQRLDEGRYGICEDCGEDIDAARLRAQPSALRCIRCQSAAERHQGAPGH
ncbi:TraR/DksA family transcriptional regulator [Pseudorhodoferax sp.]|uniref:TraR/DksA family transcriptional regulator n=1 Tax=Pseudorhodoferax sp. TaxID=1993553 RepID=UPI0039E3FFBC